MPAIGKGLAEHHIITARFGHFHGIMAGAKPCATDNPLLRTQQRQGLFQHLRLGQMHPVRTGTGDQMHMVLQQQGRIGLLHHRGDRFDKIDQRTVIAFRQRYNHGIDPASRQGRLKRGQQFLGRGKSRGNEKQTLML